MVSVHLPDRDAAGCCTRVLLKSGVTSSFDFSVDKHNKIYHKALLSAMRVHEQANESCASESHWALYWLDYGLLPSKG